MSEEKKSLIPKSNNSKENKSKRDFNQRQLKAQRLMQIASLIHAGKTQEEMAEMLNVSQGTISNDYKRLREKWMQQATEKIDEWKSRELAFAVEQRVQAQIQWQTNKEPRYNELMIKWTDRIAKLLGLDAPIKFKDVTKESLIEQARREGIENPEQDPVLGLILSLQSAEMN